jgi:hypothetical protein
MKMWLGDGRTHERETPLRITTHAFARVLQTLGPNPEAIRELISELEGYSIKVKLGEQGLANQNFLVYPHPYDQESDVLLVMNRDDNGHFILKTVIRTPREGGSGVKAKTVAMMRERGIDSFLQTSMKSERSR